jgi:hypothetical protein
MADDTKFIKLHPQESLDCPFAVGLMAGDAGYPVLSVEWELIGNVPLDHVDRMVSSGMDWVTLDAGFAGPTLQGRRTLFDMA